MSTTWRQVLLQRLGLSLGLATLWVWGLMLARIPRDGLLPLEVWFGYSLSFFMTTVYVYMGLLILAVLRLERGGTAISPAEAPASRFTRLARFRRPLQLLGVAGFLAALVSLILWLATRYPGPQAWPGTISSLILALMILGVVIVATWIARGAR